MYRDMSNAQTAEFYAQENRSHFPILVRYQTGEEVVVDAPENIRFGVAFTVLQTKVVK